MSNRICNSGTCTLVFLILTIAASRPATALPGDWINFVDETSTRIVVDPADPSVGIGDTEEKDMAIGDLDKDGDLDLVIVRKAPAYGPALRNVLYMNENGIMVERTSTLAPDLLDIVADRDVVIVDVDGDTWPDVVTAATSADPHRVYMNLGEIAGVWQGLDYNPLDDRIPAGLSGFFCGVAAGFVNGDGAVDLYFAGYLGQNDMLLINDGNGFFTLDPQMFLDTGFGVGAQIIDLNGDGANDIIKVNSKGPPVNPLVIVYYNDPLNPGQFGAAVDLIDRVGADPYMFIAGDLNKLGNPDVYIVRDSQDTYLINTGNDPGTGFAIFTELTVLNSTNTDAFGGNIRLVDWNGDGFLEPVVATFDAEDPQVCPAMNPVRRLAALRNDGNGLNVILSDPLDPATRFWNTFDTHDIVVFDIDGDGLLDMWSGTCTGNNVFMGVATGACCLPDGSCAILTETECDAQCGTYQGDGVPCLLLCVVQATEACCFPDDTCQDLHPCLCAQQGGTSKGSGTTCADPGICDPPPPTGACCLPNGGGCIVTTEEDCLNRCGDYKGDGIRCNRVFCPIIFNEEIVSGSETLPPSEPTVPLVLGACCFADDTCSEISECNCDNQGGTYQGDGTSCASVVCGGGQCCILGPPFTCTDDVLEPDCLADCGVWTDLFTCSQVPCPSFVAGACCLEDVCVDGASQSWCECQGGVYRGDFTECSCITTCGPPNGACCLQSGTCVENTADECDAVCGSFSGEGSLCEDIVSCPIIEPINGACCLLDGTCTGTWRCNCESQGGLWQGDNTDCVGTTCPAVCGGIQGIPCLDVNEFCKFGEGECCCDFKGFCTPIPDGCVAVFDPVCGCDGITYGNACAADRAQVTVLHAGECTGSCCLPEGVCVDGLTENECTCQCGEFGGNNSVCADPTCVPPVEACCLEDGVCVDLVACECTQLGGTPQGGLGTCANLPPNTCAFCADASTKGCWGDVFSIDVFAVNAVALKTGKVLISHRSFSEGNCDQPPGTLTGRCYQLFDPATDMVGPLMNVTTEHNLYCGGFNQLADGRVLFVGSVNDPNHLLAASIYDPILDQWFEQEDAPNPRFYPTVKIMPDGRALVIGGSPSGGCASIPDIDIFDANLLPGSPWTSLPNAAFRAPPNDFELGLYPRMEGLSDGSFMYTGSTFVDLCNLPPSDRFTRVLDPVLELWTKPFTVQDTIAGGPGVLFATDMIMKANAGIRPGFATDDVYVLDMTVSNPAWVEVASMNKARRESFLLALPDGKIVVTGGKISPGNADVLEAEIYDPAGGFGMGNTWTLGAAAEAGHSHGEHSSAVLLVDGRILAAGFDATAEIYYPPNLFNSNDALAERPVITGVNGAGTNLIRYGQRFSMTATFPAGETFASLRLIRLGMSTHSLDHGQQSMALTFVPDCCNPNDPSCTPSLCGGVTVAAPLQPALAPPGYYYLFLVSTSGVPSIAAIVQLELCP